MTLDIRIQDYPKIQCPFVRQTISGRYIVTPEITLGYEWVFQDPGVKAVDKLHGSNHCIIIDNGEIVAIDNRKNRKYEKGPLRIDHDKQTAKIILGVMNSINRGWIYKKAEGRIYGELIGPDINTNLHEVNQYYFVPFDYLKEKCHWKSWLRGDYPKTFESISEWFKELPSLFTRRIGDLGYAEGLVFTHQDGRMAKLRRDMFDWCDVNLVEGTANDLKENAGRASPRSIKG